VEEEEEPWLIQERPVLEAEEVEAGLLVHSFTLLLLSELLRR
jgi:hypothetical protein